MDKYIIMKDRKITFYIIFSLLMLVVSYIFVIFSLQASLDIAYSAFSINAILWLLLLFLVLAYYFILKDCLQIIKFKKEYMKYGTLGMMHAGYHDIQRISFDENINLEAGNKKRKVRVFNINENSVKYRAILFDLRNKTGMDFDPDKALDTLKKHHAVKYETGGPPLRIGGWLMVIFVSLIISSISNILLLGSGSLLYLLNSETTPVAAAQAIYIIINFIVSVTIVILMTKRMKAAITLIKASYVLNIINTVATAVLSYFTPELTGRAFSAYMIASIFSTSAMTLLVFRYLKISKRVQKTFIYHKSTTITKADKSVDPPFKLFSKEPASLYGIFSWLIMPVAIILLIIIAVIVMIITNIRI